MKKNKISLAFIVLLVIIILFSNVGESFKDDIFSYDNTNLHYKNISKISSKSKDHQEFMNSYSNYLIDVMSYYKVKPINGNSYFSEYISNISFIKYPSSFEVYSSYGKLIKRYTYNIDFLEDFKGNITSGIVKSNFIYADNFNTIANNPHETVLYDGYKNKTNFDIIQIDGKLKSLGVSGVISPSYTNDLKYDSYINNIEDSSSSNRGLAKFIVRKDVFDELKYYSQLGYAIKIKSGATIQNIKYKNIYGVIKGKNTKYKPLILISYYDDEFKSSYKNNHGGTISTSLFLDCIRSINFQRLNKPDRTIILALLPRSVSNNQVGFEHFLNQNLNGDLVILNNIGLGNEYILSYTKDNSLFCNAIEGLLNKNNFNVVSKSVDTTSKNSYVLVDCTNPEYILKPSYEVLSRSSKFFLSIIHDECYNLDFLSGNVREIRSIKKFISHYSIIISIIALLLVLLLVFKNSIRHIQKK